MHRFTGRPSVPRVIRRALLAGFSAGLRTATPIGVMAAERNDASFRAGWKNWPLFRSGAGRFLLQMVWAGELIADKMPFIPPRTNPMVMASRIMVGGIAGLAVGSEGHGAAPRLLGMMAGVAGAAAGARGGYAYRTQVAESAGMPDLMLALPEDIAAYAIARKGIKG